MLNPRPVPSPTSRVVKNGSKIRERFALSMPCPSPTPAARPRRWERRGGRQSRAGASRVPHRLFGIEHEIEENLLQLSAVCQHLGQRDAKLAVSSTPAILSEYSRSAMTCWQTSTTSRGARAAQVGGRT